MIDYVKDSHTIVYESNHEENVLLSGPYPWSTKQRILSDRGHLSNTDSANYLAKIVGDNTKKCLFSPPKWAEQYEGTSSYGSGHDS